ncbi:hypothetical protein Trydic_g3758 [Trypoxylus dichotomus]
MSWFKYLLFVLVTRDVAATWDLQNEKIAEGSQSVKSLLTGISPASYQLKLHIRSLFNSKAFTENPAPPATEPSPVSYRRDSEQIDRRIRANSTE